jgi:two-component system cell cycle response regulator
MIRKGDVVGRYGGEEFGLVLPDTVAEQAYQLCERIRKFIAEFRFDLGPVLAEITVSIGVCVGSSDFDNYIEIIQMADRMLYEAKAKGRNQVVIA